MLASCNSEVAANRPDLAMIWVVKLSLLTATATLTGSAVTLGEGVDDAAGRLSLKLAGEDVEPIGEFVKCF